jgi:hypothetical protein
VIDTPVTDAERVELQRRRMQWGQLRRWLKDHIAASISPNQHMAEYARARYRDVLREMDMLRTPHRSPTPALDRLRRDLADARDESLVAVLAALDAMAAHVPAMLGALGVISRSELVEALKLLAMEELEKLR